MHLRLQSWLLLATTLFLLSEGSPPPAYLFLAIDGVGQIHVQQAREKGYLSGFQPSIPVVSTFPSLTSVAFTGMTRAVGQPPAPGYENRFYDWKQNRVHGAIPYILFPWHHYFDIDHNTLFRKAIGYFWPLKISRSDLGYVMEERLASDEDVVRAYLANSDALAHMRGVGPTVEFLKTLGEETAKLRKDFQARTGRTLHVIVFSDHGQTPIQQHAVRGFKDHLKRGGFSLENSIHEDRDVAIARFGYVEAGMLFCHESVQDRLARWMVQLDGVELSAYRRADSVAIVSRDGSEALVDVRGESFRYRPLTGDPLQHKPIEERLRQAGKLDADGFAPAEDWLLQSLDSEFPDALYRLHAAFFGSDVENQASVIFTTLPGRAFGHPITRKLSWLRGGKLEATHGSLRRDPSLATLFTDMPDLGAPAGLRYDQVLPFLERLPKERG